MEFNKLINLAIKDYLLKNGYRYNKDSGFYFYVIGRGTDSEYSALLDFNKEIDITVRHIAYLESKKLVDVARDIFFELEKYLEN